MQNTYDELAGYVETFPDTTSDGNCGIFALDCEMVSNNVTIPCNKSEYIPIILLIDRNTF